MNKNKKHVGKCATLAAASLLAVLNGFNGNAANAASMQYAQPYGQTRVAPPVMGQAGYVAVPEPQTIIAAYQKPYAMNFEIWKPAGLPAGWYATFDGYPVAQISEHRWVYGQMNSNGVLAPTNVLVGSVVPMDVPGLTRVTTTWVYSRYLNNAEFWKVLSYKCDRIGYLNDPMLRTPVAWNSHGGANVWVWLGERWKKFTPQRGEYTWQALRRHRDWIIEQLHKSRFWWWGSEPWDLADLARQRGLIWVGKVNLMNLSAYNPAETRDRQTISSPSPANTPSTPNDNTPNDNGGGNWDVD